MFLTLNVEGPAEEPVLGADTGAEPDDEPDDETVEAGCTPGGITLPALSYAAS